MTNVCSLLAPTVYGNTPIAASDDAKPESNKSLGFTKAPRVTQLDENRLQAKVSQSIPPHTCCDATSFYLPTQMKFPPTPSPSSSGQDSMPAKVTPPAQLAKIAEFKEALASAELVDPTAPSVAIYCVHSTDNP